MKTILPLTLLLISQLSISQIPDYFENNQEWSSSFSFYSPGISDCIENSAYVDYVNGDTLISGQLYKKIGRRSSTSYTPMSTVSCPANNWSDVQTYRLLRQSNDSIFEYSTATNMEELVITYNLSVGDSFSPTNYINSSYTVQQIDLISLNGQNHRVFTVDTVNNYVVIEGVGHYSSERGGFLNYWGFETGLDHVANLSCYAQNNTTFWNHPDNTVGSCSYLHNLGVTSLNSNHIKLFPNPVKDLINIESDLNVISIKITSLSGTTILRQGSLSKSVTVNTSSLPYGIYLIIIQYEDGGESALKFQKI